MQSGPCVDRESGDAGSKYGLMALPFCPQPKPLSRLEQKVLRERHDDRLREQWKRAIWDRDQGICRCCGVQCVKGRELHPRRGECHHLEGRANRVTRWDTRNGCLVCNSCHERITGSVNAKLVIQGLHYFTVDNRRYLNAAFPLQFVAVA